MVRQHEIFSTPPSPLVVPQLCPTVECQESRFSQGAAFKAMYQVLFDLVDPGRFPEAAPAQPDAKNAGDNESIQVWKPYIEYQATWPIHLAGS